MGTGILAIGCKTFGFPLLAKVLFYFNVVLFGILLIPWILRWVLYAQHAFDDLYNPLISHFYATLPVGMLVIAAGFHALFGMDDMAQIFWWPGAILTFLAAILIPYVMFKHEGVKIEHIYPGWFIPPVGMIVIPIGGSIVLAHTTGLLHDVALVINIVGLGTGIFLYLSLLAICMYRFILYKLLPNKLAPTIWINLGPIGAGTLALFNLFKTLGMAKTIIPLCFILWGFGIWWVVIAILMTVYYIRKLTLPYTLSWWAFIFPLGAYVNATGLVAKLGVAGDGPIGLALLGLLAGLWIVTLWKTVCGTFSGQLFGCGN